MTNNKRNINHTRFVRKEKKEIKEENNHDLTKDKDPRRKEIANLNRGKFFLSKNLDAITSERKKGSMRHNNFPNWGKIFLSKNFGRECYNSQLSNWGKFF